MHTGGRLPLEDPGMLGCGMSAHIPGNLTRIVIRYDYALSPCGYNAGLPEGRRICMISTFNNCGTLTPFDQVQHGR